jgi:hypothetical protein
MKRFLISLLVGGLLGLGTGVFLGWGPFPVEYTNGPVTELRQVYKDDYTVMVAEGYVLDDDRAGAFERLRMLQVESIPQHVQDVTERYISSSADIEDIRALVALSDAMGRLTPIMEPYQQVSVPGVNQ